MLEKKIIIQNETGIHARPASLVVKEAQKYQSEIILLKEGSKYNCKSIMNIMSMGAKKGEEIHLTVSGDDEEEAFSALVNMLENSLDA
ncbi:phosphocarrier protein [Natronincola peptidivorans]|uniref:Phosphocarrier protein HPr n=1 Tax=Natronincola peptidivorans TaxID=426128 RepID=A0A1I0ATP6_9FIRM|nr:HPr family phosphocarrier protein [Natronincola peptidivorans]SES96919.1 phosphocarrier protein [Natronincola peptidivorans]